MTKNRPLRGYKMENTVLLIFRVLPTPVDLLQNTMYTSLASGLQLGCRHRKYLFRSTIFIPTLSFSFLHTSSGRVVGCTGGGDDASRADFVYYNQKVCA